MNRSTRREFLVSLLGAAAAQSACRRPWRGVPGEIRGASAEVGHRLRNPELLGEPTRTERTRVLIVGGGPSGLGAGWRLVRLQFHDFLVVELEQEVGGTSSFGRDGVVPYPWGAHYVPVPHVENVALVTLLREMNAIEGVDDQGQLIPAEGMVVREPEERLFFDGIWHEGLFPRHGASNEDLAQFAQFQREILELSRRRDGRGRRPFTLPMELGSDDPLFTELDQQSMAQWMTAHGYSSERLRWYVDYACRDDYGLRANDTSAWAGLFYFASRLGPDGSESAPLFTWTNGNGRLVEHLTQTVGHRRRTGYLLVDLATVGEQVEAMALDRVRNEVVRIVAERAIFAAPKFLAPKVLRQVREDRPSWPSAFVYGAWMVANLHLRARPSSRGAPMAWDNVLYDSPSLGYVVATHQAQIDEGPTILTYYYPYTDSDAGVGRRRLFEAEHANLADLALSDLAPAHRGLSSLVTRVDVMRWGHAMPRPTPGFLARRRPPEPASRDPRVLFAHTDRSGIALF
ncbi:MAG: NAD(P)-binding protein, partial [Myxococcales bacterium]|nr:NAD(P)-binding protein [Polyangiaceae bacterium]MDW8249859.1 NAD(P)-binding protein [Myxococcales bacterium]